MCGRFTQTSDAGTLAKRFEAVLVRAPVVAGYNIAPTSPVTVIVPEGAQRALEAFRWGLVPGWARSLKDRPQPINAKAETLASSRMFARLLPSRRCLVVADGFYEWRREGAARLPVRMTLRGGEPFAFAGLWDVWNDPSALPGLAPPLRSCTIVTVTVPANSLVAPVHDRMPAILRRDDEARWLDPGLRDPKELARLLAPFDPGAMALYPVSPRVNDARNQGPELILPLAG